MLVSNQRGILRHNAGALPNAAVEVRPGLRSYALGNVTFVRVLIVVEAFKKAGNGMGFSAVGFEGGVIL